MRWAIWICGFIFVGGFSLESGAQTVQISKEEYVLDELFDEVEAQTGKLTLFSNDELDEGETVRLEIREYALEELYACVLQGKPLEFAVLENYVVIRPIGREDECSVTVVTGKVSDEKGYPLPGVTIVIKGTQRGVTTDHNGIYSMTLPERAGIVLTFSFVGKRTMEVEYMEGDTLNVVLPDVEQKVEEVVVMGYQNVSRRHLTSAVTSIKAKDLLVAGKESVDQMLEGLVPGMIFMLNSGQIGVSPRLRIRGTSTIMGNQEPLWVIDGIVQSDPVNIDVSLINDLDYVNLLGNAISALNPDDVERIDVLKDASATALYGIRAANGVIVVTTKKGRAGPLKVDYHFTGSLVTRPRYTDRTVNMMNALERIDYSREMIDKGITLPEMSSWVGYEGAVRDYYSGELSFQEFQEQVSYLETINTDWFDVICRDAFSHRHHLSFSGGTSWLGYYASLGYDRENGILKKEHGDRYTARISLDGRYRGFGYALDVAGNAQKRYYTPSESGLLDYAYNTSRAIPVTNPDGSLWYYPRQGATFMVNYNVLNERDNSRQVVDIKGYSLSLKLSYRLMNALDVEAVAAYGRNRTEEREWFNEDTAYARDLRGELYDGGRIEGVIPYGGETREDYTKNRNYTLRGQLNFHQEWGASHRHFLSMIAGGEVFSSRYTGKKQIYRGGLSKDGKLVEPINKESNIAYRRWYMETSEAQGVLKHQVSNMASLYASLTYSYRDLYIFNANMRIDASNKFGEKANKRMLPIWSVSGRWDVKNSLLRSWKPLEELALRLSYGFQGNMLDMATSDMVIRKGMWNELMEFDESYIYKFPDPNLTWEKTSSLNVAVDASLWEGRVSGTFSCFYKRTRDAFLQKEISVINGTREYVVNQGSIDNYGFELGLSCYVLAPGRDKHFFWRVEPQVSQVLNVLVDRDVAIGDRNQVLHDDYSYEDFLEGNVQIVGRPLNSFYSYEFAGLDAKDGRPTFAHVGEEMWERYAGMTNEEVFQTVMRFSGSRIPRVQGSIKSVFAFRNVEFVCFLTYSLGAKVRMMKLYSDVSRVMPHPVENLRREFLDRWQRPGDEEHTDIPGILPNSDLRETVVSGPWWRTESYSFAENIWQMYNNADIRVVSGNYLKLQNVSLSYACPERLCEKLGIARCDFLLSASSLAVWCHKGLRGQDVNTQTGSASDIHVPVCPSYSCGLSVTF